MVGEVNKNFKWKKRHSPQEEPSRDTEVSTITRTIKGGWKKVIHDSNTNNLTRIIITISCSRAKLKSCFLCRKLFKSKGRQN